MKTCVARMLLSLLLPLAACAGDGALVLADLPQGSDPSPDASTSGPGPAGSSGPGTVQQVSKPAVTPKEASGLLGGERSSSVAGGPGCHVVVREKEAAGAGIFGEPGDADTGGGSTVFFFVSWMRDPKDPGRLQVSLRTKGSRFQVESGAGKGSAAAVDEGVLLEFSGFDAGSSGADVAVLPRRLVKGKRPSWGRLDAWAAAKPVRSGRLGGPERRAPVITWTPTASLDASEPGGFELRVEYRGEFAVVRVGLQ